MGLKPEFRSSDIQDPEGSKEEKNSNQEQEVGGLMNLNPIDRCLKIGAAYELLARSMQEFYKAKEAAVKAEENLKKAEFVAWMSGGVIGSNAEAREACLYSLTVHEQAEVSYLNTALRAATLQLELAKLQVKEQRDISTALSFMV